MKVDADKVKAIIAVTASVAGALPGIVVGLQSVISGMKDMIQGSDLPDITKDEFCTELDKEYAKLPEVKHYPEDEKTDPVGP